MGLFRKSPPPRPHCNVGCLVHGTRQKPNFPPSCRSAPCSLADQHSAIAITGMSAYSNGFEILVTRVIRPDALGFDEATVPGAPRGMLAERQSFQISLQLSDGRTVTSGRQ